MAALIRLPPTLYLYKDINAPKTSKQHDVYPYKWTRYVASFRVYIILLGGVSRLLTTPLGMENVEVKAEKCADLQCHATTKVRLMEYINFIPVAVERE